MKNGTQKTKSTLISNAMILFIIITGLAGTVSCLKNESASDQNQRNTTIVAQLPNEINLETDQTEGEGRANTVSYSNETSHLTIKGLKVVGATLNFEIKSFNSNGTYYLDFGNGKVKKMKNKRSQFTYKTSGEFVVKLNVKYDGKTKTIHKERLIIEHDRKIAIN